MKTKSKLISVTCIAALACCVPVSGWAKEKKSASPAAKSPKALPFHGKISAVDQTAKTFSIAGKETTRIYKITDKTVITKDGKPATMADVTETEEVRGSYWKQADGSLEAKTVKLGEKAESKPATKKEKAASESMASPSPAASPKATP
jgi:hypothetical protein